MARLISIDPARATGRVGELFRGPLKGMEFNLFKSAAASPAALEAMAGMFGALSHGVLGAKEREAIALAVSQANGCDYCIAAHTALGKMAGTSAAEAQLHRRGTGGDARTRALLRFAGAILEKRGDVSDAEVEAFREAGFSDAHLAEVVANVALTVFTNYFNTLNRTAVDFPEPPAL